ncbi:MAG: DUF4399 domain-containing protein [Burkholderiaceae bacterium]|nr:DUF4399 domain-containing protein [Burkholderiaceae bacterium]
MSKVMSAPLHSATPFMLPAWLLRSIAAGSAVTLVAGLAGLAGCTAPSQSNTMHASMMATSPARMNASAAVLPGGYPKVASVAGTSLYFIGLKNGDTVSNPVLVQFGLRGMGVAPAGMEKAATGHHHLLIDVSDIDTNAPVAVDDSHRHFGAGQTEASLTLKPGPHTLQLLLADQNHIPHHPAVVSERITVMVK